MQTTEILSRALQMSTACYGTLRQKRAIFSTSRYGLRPQLNVCERWGKLSKI